MADEMSLETATRLFRFEVGALKGEVTSLKEELQQVALEMRSVANAMIELRTLDSQGKISKLETRFEELSRGQYKVMTILVALNSVLMLVMTILGLYAAFKK
jgi:hypothetical protein